MKALLSALLLLIGGSAVAQTDYTPPSQLLSVHGTLATEQIRALGTAPATVIPAPGPGLVINFIQGRATLNYGTTTFSGTGGQMNLTFANALTNNINTTTAGFLKSSALDTSGVRGWQQNATPTAVANQAVVWVNPTGDLTGGDSTVTYDLLYNIVPAFPP